MFSACCLLHQKPYIDASRVFRQVSLPVYALTECIAVIDLHERFAACAPSQRSSSLVASSADLYRPSRSSRKTYPMMVGGGSTEIHEPATLLLVHPRGSGEQRRQQ
eukprot:scaffold18471_cov77-Attheya_sp.AAC.3